MDTLHVRLPADAPFRPQFGALYAEIARQEKICWRSTPQYEYVTDLRPFGHPAILHMVNKVTKDNAHKLELTDAGAMSLDRIKHEIEQVFDVNPDRLDLMRLDVCANVEGTPVEWFHDRTRVLYKQWTAKIGFFEEMGKRQLQTIYFGKRPNCLRIYDKTAELRARYVMDRRRVASAEASRRMDQRRTELVMYTDADWMDPDDKIVAQFHAEYQALKKEIAETECPTFTEWTALRFPKSSPLHGMADDAVMTRVERQMGGGRIPLKIAAIGRLKTNLPDFNPFEKVRIESGADTVCDPNFYFSRKYARLETYGLGMFLRERAQRLGLAWARSFVNTYVGDRSNAARTWERVREFMPGAGQGVTEGQLFEVYRESVKRQLAA
jgi:hypothetical protein